MDELLFYKGGDGYRWRRTSENGNITGASTEAYNSEDGAEANATDQFGEEGTNPDVKWVRDYEHKEVVAGDEAQSADGSH